jgi:Trk K+ transport system NAD-binding subunit
MTLVASDHPSRSSASPANANPQQRRRSLQVAALYTLAVVREFRWTLLGIAAAVLFGGFLFYITPVNGERPGPMNALFGGWMALLAQPLYNPPPNWYLAIVCGFYPLIGAVLIGEGVFRLALLMTSRRRGEKEWVRIMASTYRDHVIVCGIGHLGVRVIENLVQAQIPCVALERSKTARFVAHAAELNVPILIRDMKEDQALKDAGVEHARAIVICANDSLGNLEVALDARRMNPKIRVVMRLFDEQIVQKLSDAMDIDVAFSSSMVAAPIVTAMALQCNTSNATAKVLSSTMIDGVCHVAAELHVTPGSALIGKKVGEVERSFEAKLLARSNNGTKTESTPDTTIAAGDRLVVHAPTHHLAALSS